MMVMQFISKIWLCHLEWQQRKLSVVLNQSNQMIHFPIVRLPDLNTQMFFLMLQLCIAISLISCSRQLNGTNVTKSRAIYQ